ncbi:hypothetical protein D3C73_1174060 [compost metagenome]
MKVTPELLASYQSAESLTDEEVKALLAYYNGVRLALLPCPPEYKLLLQDVRMKADRLQDMADARKESRARGAQWAKAYSTVTPRTGQQVDCLV